ncbi:serine/threonine protein kinase [Planotetraspora sp. A-T 1434]|uniref:serine/threonine-protein kinase n=1 Tax=Planotetraspora sp. A-T 1434 TaxID=2979219 RepID=UPI0021BF4323|nr:serine/threonine-protein kinase [Planotetraspora sp. A-T 1434]MCT9934552.1 serine/threonine protein kinase [Planotetraspora sp. A-T 1434]
MLAWARNEPVSPSRQVSVDPLDRSDPRRIGGISLHGRLGSGGMGRVFYGVTEDYEQVAVKVIREDLVSRAEVRARFARETDALRTVQGPQVAALVDASGDDEERPWLAVEYVRGLSLKEFVETRGTLSGENAATLGVLLASGLKDIHAAGLLHRDLKPGNVLLGRDGPKVIDLGLVAFADGPTDLTTTESTLGTPACMSPEQANTPKQVTTAADVYSLGATLMFALAKHYPYDGKTVAGLFMNIVNPEVAPNLEGVPAEFEQLISAMLAHDPAVRPTVSQTYDRLKELATAGGITLPVATRRLAVATYVELETDPHEVAPLPRPRRRDLSEVVTPDSVVARLADRLRGAYAANARF